MSVLCCGVDDLVGVVLLLQLLVPVGAGHLGSLYIAVLLLVVRPGVAPLVAFYWSD